MPPRRYTNAQRRISISLEAGLIQASLLQVQGYRKLETRAGAQYEERANEELARFDSSAYPFPQAEQLLQALSPDTSSMAPLAASMPLAANKVR